MGDDLLDKFQQLQSQKQIKLFEMEGEVDELPEDKMMLSFTKAIPAFFWSHFISLFTC